MRFRKLRIAWSVFWGVACVLLIVLWVRTYYTYDDAYHGFPDKRGYIIESINGKIVVEYVGMPIILDSAYGTRAAATGEKLTGGLSMGTYAGFRFWADGSNAAVVLPFWFLIVLSAALTVISPPMRWRFSLLTLLIATTLVAVVLGLAGWAASK